jgi:putative ABC transport system ATP-binding protein
VRDHDDGLPELVDEMHKPTAEAVLDRMKDFDARGRTS